MKQEMIRAIAEEERDYAVHREAWEKYQVDIRKPGYVENCIRTLPEPLRTYMAEHSLRGIRYTCSDITPVGNRWWIVRWKDGKPMSSVGGRYLQDVVRRVQRYVEDVDGLLAS